MSLELQDNPPLFAYQLPANGGWETVVHCQRPDSVRRYLTDRDRREGLHYRLMTAEQLEAERLETERRKSEKEAKEAKEATPTPVARKRAPRKAQPTGDSPSTGSTDTRATAQKATPAKSTGGSRSKRAVPSAPPALFLVAGGGKS